MVILCIYAILPLLLAKEKVKCGYLDLLGFSFLITNILTESDWKGFRQCRKAWIDDMTTPLNISSGQFHKWKLITNKNMEFVPLSGFLLGLICLLGNVRCAYCVICEEIVLFTKFGSSVDKYSSPVYLYTHKISNFWILSVLTYNSLIMVFFFLCRWHLVFMTPVISPNIQDGHWEICWSLQRTDGIYY